MTRVHVRVTKSEGNTTVYELLVDGCKVADLTPIDIIEAAMNFASALRFWK